MKKKESKLENTENTENTENKKNRKGLKVFGITVLTLIIILVLIISFIFWYVHDKLSKIQKIDLNVGDLNISTQAEESLSDFRNIALFGVDSREDDYGKGNRSDCIIIASINNNTKEIKLLSVYRDTYLEIEGYGLDKVTHAYSYGEAPLAIKTLNTNLDLNIKEFVTVNFDSLATAINKLGGVSINIQEDELKYINGYIDDTSKNTGIPSTHVTQAGTQNLDGIQAVAYSRIRYTEGGDQKRAERMRTVLTAMIEKIKTKDVFELNSLADEILPKIYTNISSNEIISLIPNLMSYSIKESKGWPYETKGITLDRWYGVPVNLENNVIELHKTLFGNQEYIPSDKVKEISNNIMNKTGYR